MKKTAAKFILAAAATCAAGQMAYADATSDFYKDATIAVLCPFGAGGGYCRLTLLISNNLGMPVVREIHAKKKVRYLSIDGSPKTLAELRRLVSPGLRLVKMSPLKHLGLPKPTTMITSDSYLVTHKDADPAVLKATLNALWENEKEVQKAHFSLRGFKNKTAATNLPMLPYHPVAIEFYKSKGIWNSKIAAANAAIK